MPSIFDIGLETPAEASAAESIESPAASKTEAETIDTTDFSPEELQELEGLPEDKRSKYIPRSRFDKITAELNKVRGAAAKAERFEDLLDDLEEQGYKDTGSFRAAVNKNQEQAIEAQRTKAEQTAVLEYNKQIKLNVDEAVALKDYEMAVREASATRDANLSQLRLENVKALQKRASGSSVSKISQLLAPGKYPDADADILRDFAKIPGYDLEAAAKRMQEKHDATIAKYAAKKGEQGKVQTPLTGSGSGSSPSGTGLRKINSNDAMSNNPTVRKKLADDMAHNEIVWKEMQAKQRKD